MAIPGRKNVLGRDEQYGDRGLGEGLRKRRTQLTGGDSLPGPSLSGQDTGRDSFTVDVTEPDRLLPLRN